MIRFFSKIRKSLLDEGKAGRYTKYAIGEIFLVVIGILIALQINNWNEERKLQSEINIYLAQKLENLKADKARLLALKSSREQKANYSRKILEAGLDNFDTDNFTEALLLILIERHFVSTIERNETSITKYYSGQKEAPINRLEQLYVNTVLEMKFEESRLNTFSENAELLLWSSGFFNDNRELFVSIPNASTNKAIKKDIDVLITNDLNAKKSLEGILRRNEVGNPNLILQLEELIDINQQLTDEINRYLR